MSAQVGDVIQPGGAIPGNVVEVVDNEDDRWTRTARGHWHMRGTNATRCERDDLEPCRSGTADPAAVYAPLTVTAVREPEPAEAPALAVVGQKITDLPIPENVIRMHGLNALGREEDVVLVVEVGNDNASYWTAGHMECWNDEDIPRSYFPLTVNKVREEPAAEPQQPDAGVLLDLVEQYGSESYQQGIAAGQRDEGSEDHYDDKARALFARIAALIPQQPVQARNYIGEPLWIHTCGTSVGSVEQPDDCGLCENYAAPWLPLLVGGDPVPEQPSDHAFKPSRVGAPSWKCAHKGAGGFVCGRDEGHHFHQPAEPGPLRLTLPEVPEGTVGATGHQRWRIVKVPGIALPCWQSDLVGPLDLGAMLDAEPDGVTVELAPPREPRTWPALKPGPSPVDLPEYVTVQGWGGYGLRSDGLYANTDGYADDVGRESCHTFDSLRALGDLVEADENGDPA